MASIFDDPRYQSAVGEPQQQPDSDPYARQNQDYGSGTIFDDPRYSSGTPQVEQVRQPDDLKLPPWELRKLPDEGGWLSFNASGSEKSLADVDPTMKDYGIMFATGATGIAGGVGWLAQKLGIESGKSLQDYMHKKGQKWMQGLSRQARAALMIEFTSRDRGELITEAKWNRAKLQAVQSLLGTAAGMGIGSLLTKGLMAAGSSTLGTAATASRFVPNMTKTVTTPAGRTALAPTMTAQGLGYGTGEALVAAPAGAAEAQAEVERMTHEQLWENSIEYRAAYAGLENMSEAARQAQAKNIVAGAVGGDAFKRTFLYTFMLSAPLSNVVGKMAAGVPLSKGGGRLGNIGRGTAEESFQEFLQSGAEVVAQNQALRDKVDPDRNIWEGSFEGAVGGMASGGIMGGTIGAFSPVEQTPAKPLPDQESPLKAVAEEEPPGKVGDIGARDIDPRTGAPVPRSSDPRMENQRDDYGRVTQVVADRGVQPELGYEEDQQTGERPFPGAPKSPKTGAVETRDELDIALEDAAAELQLGLESQAMEKQVALEGEQAALERQGSRNAQMIEMEEQRARQLAAQQQPAPQAQQQLEQLDQEEVALQEELNYWEETKERGGRWKYKGKTTTERGPTPWLSPEEDADGVRAGARPYDKEKTVAVRRKVVQEDKDGNPILYKKGKKKGQPKTHWVTERVSVGDRPSPGFNTDVAPSPVHEWVPFEDYEARQVDNKIAETQQKLESLATRREYEESYTAEKAAQEEEAYRQRELQAGQEGMDRVAVTQEELQELPSPTRAPAVLPEEQLEVERGIGGGGDLAARPTDIAAETEVIQGTRLVQREPRTPAPPSGTMAAREEADRRLAERQAGPPGGGSATTRIGFEEKPSPGTSVGEALAEAQEASESRGKKTEPESGGEQGGAGTRSEWRGAGSGAVSQLTKKGIFTESEENPGSIRVSEQTPSRRLTPLQKATLEAAQEMAANSENADSSFSAQELIDKLEGGTPEPVSKFIDPRLRNADVRTELSSMRAAIVPRGGSAGLLVPDQSEALGESDKRDEFGQPVTERMKRLPSENPDWYKSMDTMGLSVIDVQTVIDKMLAGQNLGPRQAKIAKSLLDIAEAGINEQQEHVEADKRGEAAARAWEEEGAAEAEAAAAEAELEAAEEREAIQNEELYDEEAKEAVYYWLEEIENELINNGPGYRGSEFYDDQDEETPFSLADWQDVLNDDVEGNWEPQRIDKDTLDVIYVGSEGSDFEGAVIKLEEGDLEGTFAIYWYGPEGETKTEEQLDEDEKISQENMVAESLHELKLILLDNDKMAKEKLSDPDVRNEVVSHLRILKHARHPEADMLAQEMQRILSGGKPGYIERLEEGSETTGQIISKEAYDALGESGFRNIQSHLDMNKGDIDATLAFYDRVIPTYSEGLPQRKEFETYKNHLTKIKDKLSKTEPETKTVLEGIDELVESGIEVVQQRAWLATSYIFETETGDPAGTKQIPISQILKFVTPAEYTAFVEGDPESQDQFDKQPEFTQEDIEQGYFIIDKIVFGERGEASHIEGNALLPSNFEDGGLEEYPGYTIQINRKQFEKLMQSPDGLQSEIKESEAPQNQKEPGNTRKKHYQRILGWGSPQELVKRFDKPTLQRMAGEMYVPFWASRNKTELSKAIHEHATKELEAIEKWEKASESFEPVAKAKKGDKYNFGFFKVFVQYGLGDKRKSQGNVKVKDVYGEIPGTVSVDGMPIDVFINPNMNKNTWDGNVFVMDYMAAGIDKYGQPYMDFTTPRKIIDHKVFVGYETAQEAHAAAIRNFTTSNQIGIPIHQHFEEMSLQDFSVWSRDAAATGKSVKEYGKAKQRRRIEEDRADLAEGQALLNAPNLSWLRKVLGTPVGDRADTELSNILVEKFLQLQERNKELEAKLELPTETYQPTFRNMREYEEARMEAELTRIEKLYPGAGLVFINSNEATEAMTGSKPKNHLERIRQYIHNMGTQAVYDTDTDTIYVFKDRIRDINHLRRVVVHEMFHKGLTRSFSDPAINKIFDNFYKNMNAEQRVEFDRIKKLYKLNEKNPVERREIIEEMFAFYAERGSFDPGFQTWFNQLIQAVKRLLARAKISSTANPWTDTEVQQLIAESHNALKRRTTPASKEEMGMRYQEEVQLEETGEIFTVERDGAVDLLAIQKRSEACERLKACLGR